VVPVDHCVTWGQLFDPDLFVFGDRAFFPLSRPQPFFSEEFACGQDMQFFPGQVKAAGQRQVNEADPGAGPGNL